MVCPYFMPTVKIDNGNWPHPSRLPLGCGWSGHCTAPGHEKQTPSQDILEAFCNLGYASSCTWAPPQRVWDAVRFSVCSPGSQQGEANAADGASRILRLIYVCERDHRPVESGQLELDISRTVWTKPHADGRIQKMAECFIETYLSRRS